VTFDTEENQARVQFVESRLVHRERLQPPSG
jgi:hypothetical protein